MTARLCRDCAHVALISDLGLRCMRARTLRDGTVMRPDGIGSSITAERDAFPESHRIKGDKCGPDGVHWRAR